MIDAFSTPHNKIKRLVLLAICGLLAVAAAAVGIDDNPPGILLAYLAATAFVLAFVHSWRTARQFGFLFCGSVLGLALFIVLNIVFAAIAHDSATAGTLQILLQGFAVAAFFLGTLIFPAAIIIGAIGSIVMFIRSRN